MWINSANVPSGSAHVRRVAMDGSTNEDLSAQFTGANHQLTVLPDETVAFYGYGSNGCDDIKERSPSGTTKTIVNSRTAHGGTGACHINNIQYSPDDQTLVFSDLDNNVLTKVTPHRHGRLGAERPRRGRDHQRVHRRHLGGRRARHPRPRPRPAPHLQQQQQGAGRRDDDGSRHQRRLDRARDQAGSHGQEGDQGLDVQGVGHHASRTTSWATCSASRTATPSSPSRPRGRSSRSTRAERCCRR